MTGLALTSRGEMPLPLHPWILDPTSGLPLRAIGVRRDGRAIWPVLGGAPDDPPPAPPAPAEPPPADPGRAGGDVALRADLARERDRRQQAERDLQALRQQQDSEQTARVRQELEAERDAAVARAAQSDTRAAQAIARTVRAQAAAVAAEEGVRGERVGTFLRLVDLSGVQLTDDGSPDEAGIRTLVTSALNEAPEFRSRTGPGERRAEPGSGHGAAGAPPADLQTQVQAALAQMQSSVGIAVPASS